MFDEVVYTGFSASGDLVLKRKRTGVGKWTEGLLGTLLLVGSIVPAMFDVLRE